MVEPDLSGSTPIRIPCDDLTFTEIEKTIKEQPGAKYKRRGQRHYIKRVIDADAKSDNNDKDSSVSNNRSNNGKDSSDANKKNNGNDTNNANSTSDGSNISNANTKNNVNDGIDAIDNRNIEWKRNISNSDQEERTKTVKFVNFVKSRFKMW